MSSLRPSSRLRTFPRRQFDAGRQNLPGIKVSDLGEALKLVREGKDMNYQGASGLVDFDQNGDVRGAFTVRSVAENGTIKFGERILAFTGLGLQFFFKPYIQSLAQDGGKLRKRPWKREVERTWSSCDDLIDNSLYSFSSNFCRPFD
jgi:hypothetical protein